MAPAANACERLADRVHFLARFVPDEFQSHMQRLGTNPASFGRESADAIHEELQTLTDGRVDIESNKNPQGSRQSSVFSRHQLPWLLLTTDD